VRGAASDGSTARRGSSRGCTGSASTRRGGARSGGPPSPLHRSTRPGSIPWIRDRRPTRQAEHSDLCDALERAVRALEPDYRAPLILRDVEGLTTAEAAAIMGLREAAFKSRLHRARLAVRNSVEEYLDKEEQA
jgi:RNA polymerase sigma-70 factor (ECF subfamily)